MTRSANKTGRSKRKMSDFVALERYIIRSAAFRSLPPVARCALLELCYIYCGNNNGCVALSASSLAKKVGVGRSTAGRALQELKAKGFIEEVRPGGFNMKSGDRRATEWRLTFHRCDVTGERPSRSFMHWLPRKFCDAVPSQSSCGPTAGQPSNATQ